MKNGEWYIPIKVYRGPDWAGSKFSFEYEDSDQNTFGLASLSFDDLIDAMKKHFEVQSLSEKAKNHDCE